MSHEGYHRIETAEMPRPDVNYLLTRLEGQLERLNTLLPEAIWYESRKQMEEIIVKANAFAKQLREALSERHIDVT